MAQTGRLAGVQLQAPSTIDPGLQYLGALRERFELAAAATGFVEHRLELGGLGLRLRFAGPALEQLLLPPFEHLAAAPVAAPELRVDVFESESTGVEPPSLPWPEAEVAPGTHPVTRYESERACVLAAAASGALTAADPHAGEAVFHLPAADRVPANERAAPLRDALHLLMAPRRRWLTHAAAVGSGGRGVLLAGRGGSGKSTLALSCALAGMEFVADDYLLLETGPPLAHAMQSTAKLTADSAARLGLDPDALDSAGFEPTLEGPRKALVDVRAVAPGLVTPTLAVGALLAPVLSDRERPALEPVAAARGLRALAPSTLIQSRSRRSQALGALAALTREVPCYELRLCPEPGANAAVVAEVVDELG